MKSKKNLSPRCSYVCIRWFLEEIRQQQPDLVVFEGRTVAVDDEVAVSICKFKQWFIAHEDDQVTQRKL